MKRKLFAALAAVALIALGIWFHRNFEFYDEVVSRQWSPKAKQNRYLAAEQYLEKIGIAARSSYRLRDMQTLPRDATLMLDASRMLFTERQLEQLLDWVDGGGQLIVGASYPRHGLFGGDNDDKQHDLLLDRLGLKRVYASNDNKTDEERELEKVGEVLEQTLGDQVDTEELKKQLREKKKFSELLREHNRKLREKKAAAARGEPVARKSGAEAASAAEPKEEPKADTPEYREANLVRSRWQGFDGEVVLNFNGYTKLEHPSFSADDAATDSADLPQPSYIAGNQKGPQLVQFSWGEGQIVALSQSDIFYNRRIAELDHALLLWLLADGSSEVLFLYGTQMPRLDAMLWRQVPELITAAALLLLFWLWHRGTRFGAPKVLEEGVRRSLVEHLSACAELHWRNRDSQLLLDSVRSALRRQLLARHPGLCGHIDDDSAQIEALIHITKLPEATLRRGLCAPAADSENEFYAQVAILQKIGSSL